MHCDQCGVWREQVEGAGEFKGVGVDDCAGDGWLEEVEEEEVGWG